MIRALYTASSGMVAQTVKQDVIANNIANARTSGFKRQRVTSESFSEALRTQMAGLIDRSRPSYPGSPVTPAIAQATAGMDPTQGPLETTGNAADLAIEGPGAFEVRSANATILTRAGNFRVSDSGELCTADGRRVMGESGPIVLPAGEWKVTQDGAILSGGVEVARLKIVGADSGQTKVLQGCLESANVNVVTEMVDMIANMRAYEANQRVISSVDGTLDKLINEAGRV